MPADYQTTVATCAGDLELRVSAATDVGSIRAVNEDSVFARPPAFLVADGMGGHAYGDRASQSLVAAFADHFDEEAPTHPAEVLRAIDEANSRVQGLVTEDDGPGAVAGTTLAGVALVEVAPAPDAAVAPHWMIFNVGDSRVYGWNGRDVVQITVDHSAVQELVALGVITAEEALVHPDRNVITRAVGSEPEIETDLWLMPVQGNQVFVACSDGLTKELEDEDISAAIHAYMQEESPELSLSQFLVNLAVGRGGRDNVSVVVLESNALGREGVEAPAAPAEE
ncbi:Protein serine/threonine phosphatase PrpC, regulation of stationary phase [Gulosibacter sp. 10]|nr:Protein serine/threonine phosphatase PrpC, regulation of stationary phase [Gulosibacter sp. 10]